MANLSLKHIYKVYPNGTKAVNDFNMEIADKEFIVFVGPSGCGKSTTLRMIAGLEEITAGELKIGDMVVNGIEPKDRDIAMVFQNYALYPHMTIYENIGFGLKMRKVPKDEIDRKVNEVAKLLGIEDYLKKKPKEMSGGQRQRVALGRAIVREPKVMLLDEPLSNLDAKLRTAMRAEIVKLHKKLQTTFIYVTHDQVEAMTMGTRIVVMKDGYVMQIDTPKNLYKYPANKFVAGFIGTPQMNFFEGTLKREGDVVNIAFDKSSTVIPVPYSKFIKVIPSYLDGSKKVIIGLRAEDVSLDKDDLKKAEAKINVRISHTEALGTETLVYGDINIDNDSILENGTRIIIKTDGFRDYRTDDVKEVALNLDAIHLFDAESEESILPRLPEFNYLDCEVKDGVLNAFGKEIPMPKAIVCDNGSGELLLPSNAIELDGDIKAKVVARENINGNWLITLDVDGHRLFVRRDENVIEDNVSIRIDFKKISLTVGKSEVKPMPLTNGFDGIFEMKMQKVKNEQGKSKRERCYNIVIGDNSYLAPEHVQDKMFNAMTGRKVFNTAFRYEWNIYDCTLADEGMPAHVEEILDYGAERFAKCIANGEEVYIKIDEAISGDIHVAFNIDNIMATEKARDIRIV